MSKIVKEYPEQGELVLCTVSNIQGTTVFAALDKYGKTGVIHTSEIAPGRIRNIRDYVVPNKKIVCKVLRLDILKGHIDLSLRRVSKKDTQEEIKRYKREQVSNKILEMVLKTEIGSTKEKILEKFETITELLELSLQNPEALKEFMNKTDAEKILRIVAEKIKPKKIFVKATLKITSTNINGISIIKNALDIKEKRLTINYLGAPNYMISLEGDDYKTANKKLKTITEKIEKSLKKSNTKLEIIEE